MRLTLRLLSGIVNSSTAKLLDYYSQFHPSVLTIQRFIDFGTKKSSANDSFLFLRKELPVRLANIMKEIDLLPDPLKTQPSVKLITGWFEQSFVDILKFENVSAADEQVLKRFHETLSMMRSRNNTVVETMAQGVMEMKETLSQVDYDSIDSRVQYFLDRFYMSRISLRMLLHQHLLLFSDTAPPSRHIGSIDPECDILAVTEDAYENARFLCEQYYNTAPDCNFRCYAAESNDGKANVIDGDAQKNRITMTYVPSHLHHILFELFKNSLRAVVEYHHDRESLPPINCIVCKGREDVIIKISDEGGGICRSEIDKLFNYMYSTAPRPPAPDALDSTPLAGYGYGLPLSRLYAKYLHGDLLLNSVDRFGTDATVFLKVLACDASELLPVFNKTSSLRYKTARQVADWSDTNHPSSDSTARL